MPLQFRRGPTTSRTSMTPAIGEPIWDTDSSALYVGDGSSAGGVAVGSGGGGGGAPTNLTYLVLTASTSLSAERVLTIGSGLSSTDGGAGGNFSIALATHTHSASEIQSGTLALARGGLAADISATGPGFLRQTSAGAAVSIGSISAADLPAHTHSSTSISDFSEAVDDRVAALLSAGSNITLAYDDTANSLTVSAPSPGAPSDATYLVIGTHASLSNERAISIGSGLLSTDGGAGASLSIALGTHTHSAGDIQDGTLALARGGLGASLSATGGTAQFLKQTASGGAVSVGTIAATEIGTSGAASTSTFLRGDMQWATPAGSSGGTKTYARFTPLDNQPTTSAYATFDTRDSGVAVLDFDSTALEHAAFVSALPEAADTSAGLKIRIAWTPDAATTAEAVWGVAFQRIDLTTDLDADAFSNFVTASAAASGTAGVPVITELTLTGTANLDSIVAGDFFRVRISRDGTHTSDALTADACLVGVEIRGA